METSDLKQKAVLWAAAGTFDNDGRVQVSTPVEINVRWEEKRRESLDPQGRTIATDARVYVDREIAVGSILWKGIKDDWTSAATGYKQVVGYSEIPDVKGRNPRRYVDVMKYSNTLPSLA